jgi:hypothetical protein
LFIIGVLCVFSTAVPITKLFARKGGGGEVEDMCYGVLLFITEVPHTKLHVFITAVPVCVYVCFITAGPFITSVPITKLFARGGVGEVEDMYYERLRAEAYVN